MIAAPRILIDLGSFFVLTAKQAKLVNL